MGSIIIVVYYFNDRASQIVATTVHAVCMIILSYWRADKDMNWYLSEA